MLYSIKHATWYSYTQPVPYSHNLVRLAPRENLRQKRLSYRLNVQPQVTSAEQQVDFFGNTVEYFSLREPHEKVMVTAESKVEVTSIPRDEKAKSPAWEEVRDSVYNNRSTEGLKVMQYCYPSPRIKTDDEVQEYAARSFPAGRPIFESVRELNSRIYTDFTFDARATTVDTPLEQVLRLRSGVCQDFAHLAIGCLRSFGLAARYVSGYICTTPPPGQQRLVGADASHAWVSAYCGPLGWVDFDPTNNVLVDDTHISLGWGRDYGDICPIQGVIVGGGEHTMGVSVDVQPLE